MTSLADKVARYKLKYDAMVAEGELLAEQRKQIIGSHQFDESKYVTLTNYRPSYTEWKAAQSDSIDLITQLWDENQDLQAKLFDKDFDWRARADAKAMEEIQNRREVLVMVREQLKLCRPEHVTRKLVAAIDNVMKGE